MKGIDLYELVNNYVEINYGFLGINKKREIIRLIFEISKIKKDFNLSFIPKFLNYEQFKRELLKMRYPFSYHRYSLKSFYLGKLELKEDYLWNDKEINEIEVIAEKDCRFEDILLKIEKKFIVKKLTIIKKLKDYIKEIKKDFNYNNRKKKFYLISEKSDFIKRCPCTSNCISCNYYIMNLGFGCPFDCEYCYLAGYQNIDGIVLNTNIYDYISEIKKIVKGSKNIIRIGTGEFTDSLVYDDITNYSIPIINFLRDEESLVFEFKTKSDKIFNIVYQKPADNFVIAYSINPPEISSVFEHGCVSYETRLKCLKELSEAGWKLAIHFDPIIFIEGWEKFYSKSIDDIFNSVNIENISWISAGSLRFYPETKKIIEKRFPDTELLNAEMVIDFDGKLRYPFDIRYEMYKNIIESLKRFHFPLEKFYLCMENNEMWNKLSLKPYFIWKR